MRPGFTTGVLHENPCPAGLTSAIFKLSTRIDRSAALPDLDRDQSNVPTGALRHHA